MTNGVTISLHDPICSYKGATSDSWCLETSAPGTRKSVERKETPEKPVTALLA